VVGYREAARASASIPQLRPGTRWGSLRRTSTYSTFRKGIENENPRLIGMPVVLMLTAASREPKR